MSNIFVSLDIETFGPIPGVNAMVELGAAAYDIDGNVVSVWESILEEPPETERDSATLKWWLLPKNYDNFLRVTTGVKVPPRDAMLSFIKWQDTLDGMISPVCYPANFDYMFVYWYMMKYIGFPGRFSFSCIDLKTFAFSTLKLDSYARSFKGRFPKAWFNKKLKHTHRALDDAIEQGYTFIQMYRQNLGLSLLES
jgi:DNA polymerase III alpha subunit (gram-positive type)